ncbi:hypothetical protein GCM10009557_73590 [Virgisporangium ochraceum]|uniref:Uncharacterized protein n=1 Tax=Virgisporangium ochraceum TaxID=65505 RepID=A0A8J4EG56_9ACTN|nr:hypothetical protein [Virgisporangium ochraceum]GIJ70797.1 hypothetical protein Voc01_057140 [Virgisporangium ochraceum]
MEDSYLAGGKLVVPTTPGETGSALLRRAVAAAGGGLRPSGTRSTRFLDGAGEATMVALEHAAYPPRDSRVQMLLGDPGPDGFGEIFLTVHLHEFDDEVDRRVPGCVLPEQFGPWTYVCGEELTDRLPGRLASLPAHASHPFGNGWLVRAVEHPRHPPAEPFRSALRELGPAPIGYQPARLAAA